MVWDTVNMLSLIAMLLAAPCLQEAKDISRVEKSSYTDALLKCREAEGLMESDPPGAIGKLTEAINTPNLKKIECIVRIELRAGEFSEPYSFLPYQYRGQARVNLAKKSPREAAQKLLEAAIEDFLESAKRKVAPSEALAKAAQAQLDRLKADPK